MPLPMKGVSVANANVTIYTNETALPATVNISLCNVGSSEARVRVSIGAAVPVAGEYIEYDAAIGVAGSVQSILERTQKVVGPGESVVLRATTANINFRVDGFEN